MENESSKSRRFTESEYPIEGETVDELTRIHAEVVSGANAAPAQGVGEKLGSARRVMELLASMQPPLEADTIARCQEDNTQGDTQENPHPSSPSDTEIPQTIGRFEVRELLGVGGFGMVFRAHDARLDRDVAIKVPTASSLLNSEARQRFERECRAVASLSHPNVVPVFEVGNDGPVSYLASEFIEGKDLSNWVQEHGVPDTTCSAQAMIRISEAIQHAHSRGVIHRDLKPANVLVAINQSADSIRFDPESIRITDFGLAKFCDEEASLTQVGSIVGTPAYSAPEQLCGATETSDDQLSDVYSLGAVFYFLLTGESPFKADSLLELIQKVQNEEPLHPVKISNVAPTDLAAICLKAMDKVPGNRYRSAWEFGRDIDRFLNCEPTVARPITIRQKFGKWCRRNPLVALLSTMFVVAMLVGFSTTYYQWRVANKNLLQVTQEKLRSDLLLQKTEESIDAMLNSTSEALRNIPSMTDVRKRMLEDALEIQLSILEQEESNNIAIAETVESLRRVTRIQRELGQFEEAKLSTLAAIELIDETDSEAEEWLMDLSVLYRVLVDLELRLGNRDEAREAAARMTEYSRMVDVESLDADAMASFNLAEVQSLKILGELQEKNGQLNAAEMCFEKAVLAGEKLCSEESDSTHSRECKLTLMSAWNSLGIIRRAIGKLEEANVAYVASLKINADLIKNDPSNRVLLERSATTSHNFANLLYQQREYNEAAVRYQKATDAFSELSFKFPSVYLYQQRLPAALSGLALIQKKEGKLELAKETTQKSIEVLLQSEKRFGAKERTLSSIAFAKRALATIDSELGDSAAADESFMQAENATRQMVESWPMNPKYHYELSLTIGNQAGSLISRRQFDLAIERLGESIVEGEKATELAPSHVRYRKSLRFVQGKLIEAMIGGEQFAAADEMVGQFVSSNSSSEVLVELASSMEHGLEHLIQDDSSRLFDEPEIVAIKNRVLSLLEAAVAKGMPVSEIDEENFKAVASDERFGFLLNSGK